MNIDRQTIEQAHERIKPYIHHTPVLTSQSIDDEAGCQVFFKCENFQKVGAFKARGAMNAALSLSPEQLSKGLATHSSGNHAQALARAAKILGVKSYIVMPRTAPDIKKRGVKGYGGEIFEMPFPGGRYGMLPSDMQNGVGGGIVKGEGFEPSDKGTVVYLNGGDDLSTPLAKVEAAGGKVLMPKTSIGENGFMAHFLDTEGNHVALHSMK